MIDINILVRQWLLGDFDTVTQLGTDDAGDYFVFGGQLPKSYNPKDGKAITLKVAGGTSDKEVLPITRPRVQLTVWADVDDYQGARAVYRSAHDLMHGANNVGFGDLGTVLISQEESHGQDITDPDTGWATVVVFFNLTVRDAVVDDPVLGGFIIDGGSIG